jgi:hypothetical protein
MVGGTSHMESFDPKPELTRHAGKTIAQSPYKSTLDSPFVKQNVREVVAGLHKVHPTIYPLQTGFRKHGESGLEVSDWWPHVGSCADDLAVVRSFWTTDNNHGAQLQPGPTRWRPASWRLWVHYGCSLNEISQFVVLGAARRLLRRHVCLAELSRSRARQRRMNIDPPDPVPSRPARGSRTSSRRASSISWDA